MRSTVLPVRLGSVLALMLAVAAHAADAPAKPAKPTSAAIAAQQRADKAKGMALATETVQRVSEAQLQLADRVLTGEATCEFNQVVNVERVEGQPGHFRLRHKKAGIVWLQIPSKSMLMNARIGQRIVDGCMHPEQRAAVAAAEAAASASSTGSSKP